jgi:hypothetical protein
MELDRESIMRSDFPLSRRGYDQGAVDAHLRALALAVEKLADAHEASVAANVSTQIGDIVAAAEAAAAQIEREARENAARLSSDAVGGARETAAHLEAAAEAMIERIDAIRAELDELLSTLRTRAEAIGAAMSELETGVGAAFGAEPGSERAAVEEPASTRPAAPAPSASEPDRAKMPAAVPGEGGAFDNARLVALDMALSGSSRNEIDSYLAANFDLEDRAALVDEVVAAAGG